jgi:DNA-binding transcriptional MocR family regulator
MDRSGPAGAASRGQDGTIDLPLVQFVRREGVIDLAWGHPDPELLPVHGLRAATAAVLDRYGAEALNYGHAAGPGPLIAWVCRRLGDVDSRAPDPTDVLATAGTSHALDQVATLLTGPGDLCLVESPTYHLAVRILRDHPLELRSVPFDEGGLSVDALADMLSRLRRAGRRPRLLYTVPTFHNPTGISLLPERRTRLVELAAEEGFRIVEDDAYRELSYDGPPPPSLWGIAPPGVVIRMGSFAKSLAPGLRTGFLTADEGTVARFRDGGLLDSGGGISHFTSLVVAEFARAGAYAANVEHLRDEYRLRRDAMQEELDERLPRNIRRVSPAGGYFTWLTLGRGPDLRSVLASAESRGTSFAPGGVFHLAGGSGSRSLRLAFSRYPPAELREGVRRLAAALRDAAG